MTILTGSKAKLSIGGKEIKGFPAGDFFDDLVDNDIMRNPDLMSGNEAITVLMQKFREIGIKNIENKVDGDHDLVLSVPLGNKEYECKGTIQKLTFGGTVTKEGRKIKGEVNYIVDPKSFKVTGEFELVEVDPQAESFMSELEGL